MIIIADSDEYYKYVYKMRNEKVLFLNGCFDLIHRGHIRFFNHIRITYGSYYHIVIGLNSDSSVKTQKKNHPLIHDQDYRAKMLQDIFYDKSITIIIFETPTPSSIIWHLMPNAIIKGSDYKDKSFPEKTIMEKIGGNIHYYDSGVEISTSTIYERVKNNV